MEAKALTPRDLFDGKVTFEIPPFQRPYVWTEEDQWQPLWDDIARVAESLLDAGTDDGACVVPATSSAPSSSSSPEYVRRPTRSWVIDGQQRLTTLQLLLDAAQLVTEQAGVKTTPRVSTSSCPTTPTASRDAEAIQAVAISPGSRCLRARDGQRPPSPRELADSRIAGARLLPGSDRRVGEEGDPRPSSPAARRSRTCAPTAPSDRRNRPIGTTTTSSIFETLNDRGTPLLAADLIKNYVFQRCEDMALDVDEWSDPYWPEFDDDWWRNQVSQGRLYRSRIDLFLPVLAHDAREGRDSDGRDIFAVPAHAADTSLTRRRRGVSEGPPPNADVFATSRSSIPSPAAGASTRGRRDARTWSVHPAFALASQREERGDPNRQTERSGRWRAGRYGARCYAEP